MDCFGDPPHRKKIYHGAYRQCAVKGTWQKAKLQQDLSLKPHSLQLFIKWLFKHWRNGYKVKLNNDLLSLVPLDPGVMVCHVWARSMLSPPNLLPCPLVVVLDVTWRRCLVQCCTHPSHAHPIIGCLLFLGCPPSHPSPKPSVQLCSFPIAAFWYTERVFLLRSARYPPVSEQAGQRVEAADFLTHCPSCLGKRKTPGLWPVEISMTCTNEGEGPAVAASISGSKVHRTMSHCGR